MVIAIIVLLAAILFPVLARARENARRATCQSNLKQLGLAVLQYSQDYDERLPILVSQKTVLDNPEITLKMAQVSLQRDHWGWLEAIFPYVKTHQVFVCPSDVTGRRRGGTPPQSSYGMNRFLGFQLGANPPLAAAQPMVGECQVAEPSYCGDRPYPLADIRSPAQKVLVTEFGQSIRAVDSVRENRILYYAVTPSNGPGSGRWYSSWPTGRYQGHGTEFNIEPVHFEGGNYLFADGHVKYLTVQGNTSPWLPQNNDRPAANPPHARYWYAENE